MAPKEQKHVAAFMWFGKGYKIDINGLKEAISQHRYSHDNIFHTLLGLMEVKASVYDKDMDIIGHYHHDN